MLTARDIMTCDVTMVTPDMPVPEVARLFHEKKISGAPVVDATKRLMGIITESDLIDQNKKLHIPTVISIFDAVVYLESLKSFEKELKKMTGSRVEDLYTREVVTVRPDTPINEIASLMAERHFHTLPVVEGEKVVGIVGKDDIVKTMASTKPA